MEHRYSRTAECVCGHIAYYHASKRSSGELIMGVGKCDNCACAEFALGNWVPENDDFRYRDLKMLETSRGVAWTAKIYYKGRHVGVVEDDGANIVPKVDFWLDPEMRPTWDRWCQEWGDPLWTTTSLDAAGAYALSAAYEYEVERHAS